MEYIVIAWLVLLTGVIVWEKHSHTKREFKKKTPLKLRRNKYQPMLLRVSDHDVAEHSKEYMLVDIGRDFNGDLIPDWMMRVCMRKPEEFTGRSVDDLTHEEQELLRKYILKHPQCNVG